MMIDVTILMLKNCITLDSLNILHFVVCVYTVLGNVRVYYVHLDFHMYLGVYLWTDGTTYLHT